MASARSRCSPSLLLEFCEETNFKSVPHPALDCGVFLNFPFASLTEVGDGRGWCSGEPSKARAP